MRSSGTLPDYKGTDARNKNEDAALSQSSRGRTASVVRLLLAKRDVNTDTENNEGYRPLHFAAKCGYREVAEVLMQSGVEVKAPVCKGSEGGKDKGLTALILVAGNGHKDVVELSIGHKEISVDGYQSSESK